MVLKQEAVETRFQALADSTRANLVTQFKAYLMFCCYFGLQAKPFVEENLVVYIQFLARSFKSPQSVKNYVYGLQTLARLHSWQFPDLSQPQFTYQFKGISRILCHAPQRAHPLSPVIFMKLLEFFNLQDPYEATMWSVMILGFLMFARISNLLPDSNVSFDPFRQLTRGDVRVAYNAIVLVVKWTKTIQFGQRKLLIPLHVIPNSPLCPKTSLLRSVKLSPGASHHHLFAYGPHMSLISRSEFTRFLRKKLSQAGFDAQKFSGHSLRRGGATWAFSQGIPADLIKVHGDWASEAYRSYLEFSLDDRLRTTSLMFPS